MILQNQGIVKGLGVSCYWTLSDKYISFYQSKEAFLAKERDLFNIVIKDIVSTTLQYNKEIYELNITDKRDKLTVLIGSKNLLTSWIEAINLVLQGAIKVKEDFDSVSKKIVKENSIDDTSELHMSFDELSLTQNCNCFIECRNTKQNYRSEAKQTEGESFLVKFSEHCVMQCSSYLEVRVCRTSKYETEPTVLGKTTIELEYYDYDIQTTSKYSIYDHDCVVGELTVTITKMKIIEPSKVVSNEYNPIVTTLDRLYLTEPNQQELSDGLFLGFCKISTNNYIDDLKYYFCSEREMKSTLNEIPFSGMIEEMYPFNEELFNQSLILYIFPSGIRFK